VKTNQLTTNRSLKDYIIISLKGMAMGAADVVPGVSGGPIAFISGIYEELLSSISSFNFGLIKTLRKEGIKSVWSQVNGNFLAALFIGIAISIVSLAKLITWLLENEPIPLWSFFFGLVLASVLYIGKQIKKWNLAAILFCVLGLVFGYMITIIPSASAEGSSLLFLFFAGAIASCAMILPGISGSYILLLMGAYSTVMAAVTEKNITIIAIVGGGVIVGLLSFSRVLKWLFAKFNNQMLAALMGIMLGSINKIWPWKVTMTTYVDRHDEVRPLLEKSVLPSTYEGDSQLMIAIIMVVVGFGMILLLEKLAVKKE
jgi:putative membrane protein